MDKEEIKKKYTYKIIFLGESGTGAKTSLISRIISNTFSFNISSTTGANYAMLSVQTKIGIIKLEIWDTPGQEKYRPLQKGLIKICHCGILGYDVTRRETFNEIKNYHYDDFKNNSNMDSLIYLVGNQIDREEREVSEEEGRNYAKEKNMKFFEISVRERIGIDELLEDIAISLIQKFKNRISNDDEDLIDYLFENRSIIRKIKTKEENNIGNISKDKAIRKIKTKMENNIENISKDKGIRKIKKKEENNNIENNSKKSSKNAIFFKNEYQQSFFISFK